MPRRGLTKFRRDKAGRLESPYRQADFTVRGPGGERYRVRRCTQTADKDLAERIADRWRREIVDGTYFDRRPELSLEQAANLYWNQHAKFLASGPVKVWWHLRTFERIFGRNRLFSSIDDAAVADYIARRRGEFARPKQRVKITTVIAEVQTLRALWRRLGKINKASVGEIDFTAHFAAMPRPDKRRHRLAQAQRDLLIDCIAPHARPILLCAMLTGLRRTNVCRLRWEEIDLEAREINLRVKSKKPGGKWLAVPIVQALFVLLVALGPKPTGYVFLYRGKPISKLRHSFKTALVAARKQDPSIPADLRFHDLRHDAAKRVLSDSGRLDLVQQMLGHEDIRTTRQYVEQQAPDELRSAMESAMGEELEEGDERQAVSGQR